jgi:hypothetical protein
MDAPAALIAPLGELELQPDEEAGERAGPEVVMHHPRSIKYVDRPKVSRAIDRPTPASPPASPPSEATPVPTDLVTIVAGARLYSDLGESQVRAWGDRSLIKFYSNPDPKAGRRSGRGRPVTRWVSASELEAFYASRGTKGRAPGAAPTAGRVAS